MIVHVPFQQRSREAMLACRAAGRVTFSKPSVVWARLHPRKGFLPDQRVCVHWFEKRSQRPGDDR